MQDAGAAKCLRASVKWRPELSGRLLGHRHLNVPAIIAALMLAPKPAGFRRGRLAALFIRASSWHARDGSRARDAWPSTAQAVTTLLLGLVQRGIGSRDQALQAVLMLHLRQPDGNGHAR